MELQTKIPLEKQSENQIDYNSNVLLIGSCFSDNIGNKLDYFKFQNFQNPFGILFNTKAIEKLLTNAVSGKAYSEADIFFYKEQWHCFDSHSKLSSTSKEDLLNDLNKRIQLTNQQIQKCSHVVITLGSAWVYRFAETNQVVANCHKVHQKQFQKELLSIDAIYQSLKNTVEAIRSVNAQVSFIFTVSPVRHLKDGFVENTQSKAHLILAIHKLLNQNSLLVKQTMAYFPSYELIMDELRDYRFYNEDMIHPNNLAINYIWEKFKEVWISEYAYDIIDKVGAIQKGLQHKAFNPTSKAHQKFLQNLEAEITQLQMQCPHIEF